MSRIRFDPSVDATQFVIGYEERGVQVVGAEFWLVFIAARAAAAWWFYLHPSHGFATTIVLALAAAVIFYNLTGGFDIGGGTVGFLLVAASYGPLLPGFLGMALETYPKQIPVSILGALLALSGLDTLVVRPVMTFIGKDRPVRTVMWAPMGLSLILWIPLMLLAILRI